MIISHKHKYIFVCPRKVASTSVRISLSRSCGDDDVIVGDEVFRPDVDTDDFGVMSARNVDAFTNTMVSGRVSPHFLPDTIRRNVGAKIWDEYFKFTVIRNPWDLVVSYIHFKFGPDWPNRPGWNLLRRRGLINARRRFGQNRARRDFKSGRHRESVEQILKQDLFPYIAEISKFYFIDGQKYADCYIRYENLQHDYDKVCRLLQLPLDALPRTKSKVRKKDGGYRDYYTEWSREYIAGVCREMIDAFGYRFD